jgi:CheY-like chemotaxis protein
MTNARRILLIDDNQDILESMLLILSDVHEVTIAPNGAEGLKHTERRAFDLILVDLMMPVLDGAGFVRALRQRHIDTPVIVMSAEIDTSERALQLGAAAVLLKPFSIDALEGAMHQVLEQRRAKDAQVTRLRPLHEGSGPVPVAAVG